MAMTSLGDLASSYMLRRHNVNLRSEVMQRSTELSTGRTSDLSRHLGADFTAFSEIDRNLRAASSYLQSTRSAAGYTAGMQSALENVQSISAQLATDLMTLPQVSSAPMVAGLSDQARQTFDAMVSTLNSTYAGRSLFAGAATDGPAFAGAGTILSSLKASIAGAPDIASLNAAIDTWFDAPGGGFETDAYIGADVGLDAFRISEDRRVNLDLRGDHASLRALLKPVALAALAHDPALGLTEDTKIQVLQQSGLQLLEMQDELTAVRANLGFAQERLEESETRISSEKLGLEQAFAALVAVDPFEAATRLEEVQFNLESLYTITARLSRLSLVEYM